MTKTFCDICGKEAQVKNMNLITEYACSAWQYRDLDVCKSCEDKIEYAKNEAISSIVKDAIR